MFIRVVWADLLFVMCYRYRLCIVDFFFVKKRIKCEFLFMCRIKIAIFATVDSDTKIKIEVYNSIIFLHNVKK